MKKNLRSALVFLLLSVFLFTPFPVYGGDIKFHQCDLNQSVGTQHHDIVEQILYHLNKGHLTINPCGQLVIAESSLVALLEPMIKRTKIIAYDTSIGHNCNNQSISGNYSFEPFGASGSCTNIFGHKWNAFTEWASEKQTQHFPQCGVGSLCLAHLWRMRTCSRTHCKQIYTERMTVWVWC
ncbi:MAG: hypothetical protein FWE90_06690 [Defluviitaleaceae bacterium]|nr:hypothetical protein [Defluviitaleaceae bacterium]